MKIVVFYAVQHNGWRWRIQDSTGVSTYLAVSSKSYTRKSDAKRGAERFEKKLWCEYIKWDNSNGNLADGPPIVIEVPG